MLLHSFKQQWTGKPKRVSNHSRTTWISNICGLCDSVFPPSAITHFFLSFFPQCLTAYNCFFQEERQRLLKTLPARAGVKSKKAHGKIGFSELGKTISRNWKKITPAQKAYYYDLAAKDKKRYLREMEEWKAHLAERDNEAEEVSNPATSAPKVVRGSVLMDDSFAPVLQVSSNVFAEQDMMHVMSTEDLMDLAVTDTSTFTFDPANTPAPATLDPQTFSAGANTTTERIMPADWTQSLDEDCQDFLVSAFT